MFSHGISPEVRRYCAVRLLIWHSLYRIRAFDDTGTLLWDSGRTESDSLCAEWGGSSVPPRTRVKFSVSVWDENGIEGEPSESFFETGLPFNEKWKAQWISGDYRVNKAKRYPVDCFKKEFGVSSAQKARLYITACGLYEAKINGRKCGDFVLSPGITDYRKRVQYQTYDVTDLIASGGNVIEVELADGWYRGSCGAWGRKNQYGTQTKFIAQLEITDTEGNRIIVCSDSSWRWSADGPILFADNKDGETVNSELAPTYSGHAKTVSHGVIPTPSDNIPVKEHEIFKPNIIKTPFTYP